MEQKSKAPLVLMEQVIMLAVFMVAAAVCTLTFTKAKLLSVHLVDRDRAVTLCQTVAETVKAVDGELLSAAEFLGAVATEEELLLYLDRDWNAVAEEEAVYKLQLICLESTLYLTKSEIIVTTVSDGETLFSLPVSWQEVSCE